VTATIQDNDIPDLYPVEENYVKDTNGLRSPKALADLATEAVCRSLPYLNGELPPGLPQDVVDDVINSLIKHSSLNATTLRALRNCEFSVLSLANARGVTDSWLEPLANKTYDASPEFRPVCGGENVEAMVLEGGHEEPFVYGSIDSQRSEEASCSSASFVSATSNPCAYSPSPSAAMDISDDLGIQHMAPSHTEEHNFGGEYFLEDDAKQSARYSMIAPTFVTTNITLLDLRGSQYLTDRGLLHLTDLSCLEIAKLDNCHSIQGRGLLAFASSHRLHTLSFTNCRRLTDEGVINISHLLALEELSLHGCRCLTDRALAALSDLYNLTMLDISQCDLITDDGIDMLERLENLGDLSLGWCRNVTDRGINILSKQPQRATNLRVLRMARCNITDEGLGQLSRLHALTELDLNGCSRISSAALGSSVQRLESLQVLDVSYCPGILRNSFQGKIDKLRSLDLCYSAVRDTHIYRLNSLPMLEELNLDSCLISDTGVRHLAENNVLPNLKSLDLADTDLTDMGMAHIAKFTKLERLSLFYCMISNNGLRHISKLTNLETLNLDSRDISDDGLRHLRPLQNLKFLDIFSGRITDTGCGHIAKITSLQALELCGGGIGDLGCSILATLENLTSLNLSQNERISNRGAAALAVLTKLKVLNLSNTRVTAVALRFFSGLKELQSLALYGCSGIENGNSISNLQNGLPNLKCIRVHTAPEEDGKVVSEMEEEPSTFGTGEFWRRPQEPEDMDEDEDEYSDHD